jgi:hypothetical protein
MVNLHMDRGWVAQINAIRDMTTEDTNLIRFDNGFYRVCDAHDRNITINLVPANANLRSALPLEIGIADFYVKKTGDLPMERYASTLDQLRPEAMSLDNAIYSVRNHTAKDSAELFNMQSLLVFCVAESIRSDYISTKIDQMIAASNGALRGVSPFLRVVELLPQARAWGQSSDAVWSALSQEGRRIGSSARNSLSPSDRQFSERVDERKLDAALVRTARNIKALKRPKLRWASS